MVQELHEMFDLVSFFIMMATIYVFCCILMGVIEMVVTSRMTGTCTRWEEGDGDGDVGDDGDDGDDGDGDGGK